MKPTLFIDAGYYSRRRFIRQCTTFNDPIGIKDILLYGILLMLGTVAITLACL